GGELEPPEDAPERLKKKAGAFVTIHTHPERRLRGCIGYPEPHYPLIVAVIKAAIAAATQDPRFPPLRTGELERCTLELSVLTPPRALEVPPARLPEVVKVGEHGIIVEKGLRRGLLLPQVAVEEGWDSQEFLSHGCIKAGLLPDCWFDEDTKVYTFTAQVFSEVSPGGEVRLSAASCRR
ncbi:MAG: TIGR00296 family protein, partial [Euryarchaeota archaeon]|nr:TIGR00296 family protein [Euryarchaeota archaeon]